MVSRLSSGGGPRTPNSGAIRRQSHVGASSSLLSPSETPAAAGRGLRFTGFAVLGVLAVATGVVYLAAAAGIGAVEDLAEALVPFDNLYLGIAVDGGVIATCVWLWKQELNTREENVQRIWAEVQRRREEPSS